jgi:hypothetical protein
MAEISNGHSDVVFRSRKRSIGFLSGPQTVLKLAQMTPRVELQFSDEPPRAVTITRVDDVGMALVLLDLQSNPIPPCRTNCR